MDLKNACAEYRSLHAAPERGDEGRFPLEKPNGDMDGECMVLAIITMVEYPSDIE